MLKKSIKVFMILSVMIIMQPTTQEVLANEDILKYDYSILEIQDPLKDIPRIEEPEILEEEENIELFFEDDSYYSFTIQQVLELYPMFDASLIKSIIYHESRFNENSYNGIAVGLMQVHEYWQTGRANNLGVYNLYDPYGNILTGVDILFDYYSGSGNDIEFALMQYNGGYGYAQNLRNQGLTSEYASSVLARAEYYRTGGI